MTIATPTREEAQTAARTLVQFVTEEGGSTAERIRLVLLSLLTRAETPINLNATLRNADSVLRPAILTLLAYQAETGWPFPQDAPLSESRAVDLVYYTQGFSRD